MAHFFDKFPSVSYDMNQDGVSRLVQNPLVRFKIQDILRNKTALFYTHDIEEGQTAQFIADRYYNDVTLDWLIYLTNDIVDPLYDWPLNYQDFINFLKTKYGSVETAKSTTKQYEWVFQSSEKRFDGTIIPEKFIVVDETTYNTLSPSNRRKIDAYTYEVRLNDEKRTIKILRKEYVPQILAEIESIFD